MESVPAEAPEHSEEEKCDDLKQKAEEARLLGNEFMKVKDYEKAFKQYSDAIGLNLDEIAAYNNRALVHLFLEDYASCIADATIIIQSQPDNIKAHYRRGKA